MTLSIRPESPRQPDVLALLDASTAHSRALYPPEHIHQVDVSALEQPDIRFLVARVDGAAAGCAGVKLFGDGTGELKRMFVTDAARGTGAAASLLAAVEATARAEGVRLMLLETGPLNHAAMRLYARAGYSVRGPFAAYEESPGSVFMEKPLA